MAKTIGSFDLASLKYLRDDVTQYFWFESDSSSAWGSGAHVTLYPESQFTDSTNPNYMKGQNIIMNTDGFSIRNGALPMMVIDNDSLDFNAVDTTQGTYVTMATFGLTGATIGQSGATRVEISEDLISATGEDDVEYFSISSNGSISPTYAYVAQRSVTAEANSSGTTSIIAYINDLANGDNFKLIFKYSNSGRVLSISTFTKGSSKTITTDIGTFAYDGTTVITFTNTTSSQLTPIIEIYKIQTTSTVAPSYTFGVSEESVYRGAYSFMIGEGCTATGTDSSAEGCYTNANGDYSHSEGDGCTAGGTASHVEGMNSQANGDCSHAQNEDTIANKFAQTVIGTYNEEDNSSTTTHPSGYSRYGQYALIIGNGKDVGFTTPIITRSNALTVDWDGRVKCGDYSGTFKSIFDIFYPVGSYYETSLASAIPSGSSTPNATDLANLGVTWFDPQYAWGGTWVLETAGQFHISAGTGYTLGATGGSPYIQAHNHSFTNPTISTSSGTHTHTIAVRYRTGVLASGSAQSQPYANAANTSTNIAYNTTNGPHGHSYSANGSVGAVSGASTGSAGNMPPYIVVNRWHRTA